MEFLGSFFLFFNPWNLGKQGGKRDGGSLSGTPRLWLSDQHCLWPRMEPSCGNLQTEEEKKNHSATFSMRSEIDINLHRGNNLCMRSEMLWYLHKNQGIFKLFKPSVDLDYFFQPRICFKSEMRRGISQKIMQQWKVYILKIYFSFFNQRYIKKSSWYYLFILNKQNRIRVTPNPFS